MRFDRTQFAAVLPDVRKRRSARSLNDGDARNPRDQVERQRFAKALSESSRIAEVAPRQYEPIRRIPIARFEQCKSRTLLALDAVRIHTVDDCESGWVEGSHDLQRSIEVSVESDDFRSIVERLREFCFADAAGGHENERADSRSRRVGRHRSGGISGARTDHEPGPTRLGVGDCNAHPRIFKRAGWIAAEVKVGHSRCVSVRPAGSRIEYGDDVLLERHGLAAERRQ